MKTTGTAGPLLEVKNLSKSFGGRVVLDNISFHINPGENLVVLGKSGTGKTVLIRCVVRLMDADTGSIEVLGENIGSLDARRLGEVRKKIGFLFQNGALYDSMTVCENLEFPLRRIREEMPSKERRQKIMETLENVGLADAMDKMPSELSGGMRKRISLARTLVVDPQLMLYDEPTSGLDPVTSREISDLILKLQKQYNTTSLLITHDMECTRSTADRVILLKEGSIYMEGTVAELEASDDSWAKEFFN
jgi:phospholipid/cholesterol/gamma-HCH transport system ATP-binding protein